MLHFGLTHVTIQVTQQGPQAPVTSFSTAIFSKGAS